MFGIHPAYLVLLLAVILIIFGPGKLPELGGAIGRGMREFQQTFSGIARPANETAERPERPADPEPRE